MSETDENRGMDLATFLMARIGEDEAVARQRHLGDLHDRLARQSEEVARLYGDREAPVDDVKPADALWWSVRDALDWIARWDPARVLAECAAKRRIVDQSHVLSRHGSGRVLAPGMRWVLASLALPYADHPDYRDEWRP